MQVRRSYERRYKKQSWTGSSQARSRTPKESSSAAPLPAKPFEADDRFLVDQKISDNPGFADSKNPPEKRLSAYSIDSVFLLEMVE